MEVERGTRRMVNVVYLLEFDTWHSIEWVCRDRSDGQVMSSTSHVGVRLVSGSLLEVKCWNKSGTVDMFVFFFFNVLVLNQR